MKKTEVSKQGTTESGKKLYDIDPIKKVEEVIKSTSNITNNSIPENGRAVNIEVTHRGYALYDITKIEDITNAIIAQYGNNPQGEFVGTSSTNSIPDNEQTVNTNSMQESEKNSQNGSSALFSEQRERHSITAEEKQQIEEICEALGRKVVFESIEDTIKKMGFAMQKPLPDGYIDDNNVIHIGTTVVNPVVFVLKHELTHFLENDTAAHSDFLNAVMDSKAFKRWIREKGFNSIDDYKKRVISLQSRFRKNFDEAKAYNEILADFVGDKLFGGRENISDRFLNELAPKPKNKIIKAISDFFKHLKQKLFGVKGISREILELENEFIKAYGKAETAVKQNPKQKNTAESGEVKFAIAGINARTADKSKLFNAMNRISQGENSETVRRELDWYKGKDGKWRFYIPDNELNVDALSRIGDTVKTLGNCIKHDKLFSAYPQLKNINIRFAEIGETKKGKFLVKENEIILNSKLRGDTEKIKDTLVHEIQHAIQHIEGFSKGGNKVSGFVYAMNMAYDKVKNTEKFRQLTNKQEKYDYLVSIAEKLFNANNSKELRYKAYRSLYGETEARQVTYDRLFDADLLQLVTPDTSGNVVNAEDESIKVIENFTKMGYTEEEIITLFGGARSDESRSSENIAESSAREFEHLRWTSRNNIRQSDRRNTENSIGSGESTRDMGTGVRAKVSERVRVGRMGRGIDSDSYSDENVNAKFSIPVENDVETLLEQYENGEITREEYLQAVKNEKVKNPFEISDLTEDDADTTPHHSRKQGILCSVFSFYIVRKYI